MSAAPPRAVAPLLLLVVLACPGRSSGGLPDLTGTYSTAPIGAGGATDRIASIELLADSGATFAIGDTGLRPRRGRWSARGPNVTVILSEPAETLGWRLIQSRLVPVRWDHDRYGEAGLTLNHR